METYFVKMNEDYIKKHYPQRSIIAGITKSSKRNGRFSIAFFGVMLAIFATLTCISLLGVLTSIIERDMEMVRAGVVFTIMPLVFTIIMILMVRMLKRRSNIGCDALIKNISQTSKYTETEIRQFEQQAISFDSYVLTLTNKMNVAISGSRDGVLTKDFVYLADFTNAVIKRDDIVSACLVKGSFYVNNRLDDYLNISIFSNKGVSVSAEVSIEAGRALIDMLKEQNPSIDTKEGNIIGEKEYNNYIKEIKLAYS